MYIAEGSVAILIMELVLKLSAHAQHLKAEPTTLKHLTSLQINLAAMQIQC